MSLSFINTLQRNIHRLINIVLVLVVGVSLTYCGLTSPDDSDNSNSASIDGDLSYEIEAPEGLQINIMKETWDGESYNSSTVSMKIVPSNGKITGDLEDGDYEAFRLQASGAGETPDNLTLKLLNDGEVQKQTSTPEEDQNIWMVQVGEFPELPGS